MATVKAKKSGNQRQKYKQEIKQELTEPKVEGTEIIPSIEIVCIKEEAIDVLDENDDTEKYEFQFKITSEEYFKIIEDLKAERSEKTKIKRESKDKSTKESKLRGAKQKCPKKNCRKTFVSAAKLAVHLELHKTVSCCHLCGKIIEGQPELKRHVAKHSVLEKRKETEKTKPVYRCDLCGNQLKNRANLQVHMETHNEKNFVECEWCGRKLKSESILREHVQLHISVKDFVCELCGREFSNEQLFIKHGPQHSTNNAFKCHVCFMSFHHQSTLCRHSKIHLEPINCSYCYQTFSFDSLYRRHLIAAHDDIQAIKLPRTIVKINYRNKSKTPSHQRRK